MTMRELNSRKMEESLEAWKTGINRLNSQIKKYDVETRVKYEEVLDRLTQQWYTAKEQLKVYGSSAENKLSDLEAGFNRTIGEIQQQFVAIVQRLSQDEDLPLGWAEGMVEHLSIEGAGWAEGQQTKAETSEKSEGWAEGLTAKEPRAESVGWAEGYDK